MARLTDSPYMAFPFRVDSGGVAIVGRAAHVRQQIEQVLFTDPGERVFRPEFGAGLRTLLFEPNASALWQITHKRLIAALADVLAGEVDPQSVEIDVGPEPGGTGERLGIVIRYRLATVGQDEQFKLSVTPSRSLPNG